MEGIASLFERIVPDLAAVGVEARSFRPIASRGTPLADESTKVTIHDASGGPGAVLLLAPAQTPGIVERTMLRARSAAEALGPVHGSVVVQPLLCGEFEGRSYAVLPWQRTLADMGWGWRLQKTWLTPRLLRWLRAALGATSSEPSEAQLAVRVREPLGRLLSDERLPGNLQRDAETALRRLETGRWRPRFALVHGDLWKGNILLPRDRRARRATAYGFYLIDWAAAQPAGFPFCDLAQIGASLSLPISWARREVRRHAELLACEPRDALGYLLLGIAELGARLEHMPLERYLRASEHMHGFLRSVLGDAVEPTGA